tara:strand:+ start:125 stop:283 length:159 start_codon:yes stop_codon:yes gene_type:complete
MYSKSITNKKALKDSFEIKNNSEICYVSKASKEIMLDRFYDGKKIEFPFQNS